MSLVIDSDKIRIPIEIVPQDPKASGGALGGTADPGVRGFQKNKKRGSPFRDKSSSSPVDLQTGFKKMQDDLNRQKKEIAELRKSQKDAEKKAKELEKERKKAARLAASKQQERDDKIGVGLNSVGSNPASIAGLITSLFPPAIIITALLSSPKIFDAIIEEMTKPGGILDTRFKREVTQEIIQNISRELQFSTSSTGRRQVIIQSSAGFASNGQDNANTVRQIRDRGGLGIATADVGLDDKAGGYNG